MINKDLINDLQIIEKQCNNNIQLEKERFQKIYNLLSQECVKYKHSRQEYLSYIMVRKFEEMKEKMIKEEKREMTNEIADLGNKCISRGSSNAIKPEIQDENLFNRAHKVLFCILLSMCLCVFYLLNYYTQKEYM